MSKTEFNITTHKFEVETLTPVSVGNGDKRTPLGDYHLENDELHYIDYEKLSLDIYKAGALDVFSDELKNVSNKRKTNFLESFVRQHLKSDISNFYQKTVDAFSNENPTELQCIIKNATGKPYLPGSSVKGAIKSALLYSKLKPNSASLKNIYKAIDKAYPQVEQWIEKCNTHFDEIEELGDEKRTLKRNFWQNKSEIEDIEKEMRGLEYKIKDLKRKIKPEQFEREISKVINDILYRKPFGQPMDFSFLRPADSKPFEASSMGAFYTERVSLKKNKTSIPLFREAIKDKQKTDFEFSVTTLPDDFPFDFSLKSLRKILNDFAIDLAEYELTTIEEDATGADGRVKRSLMDFYETQLFNPIDDGTKSIYLCIGAGKIIYHQCIALSLLYDNTTYYQKYIDLMQLNKYNTDFFPVTRTLLTSYNNMPLGWLKLTYLNTDKI